ncbi:DUF1801 domain-containing protein [Bacillus sp. FJAT-47783]|uniref:iron chaperone n=1 Tax=Bacillus sp. FJAT-47783 TaxID=2922712 RepID=UPI001FACD715|nr:DUF1801 domain-containing protein [Bacillus sp. FJAT-47783]
MHIPANNVDEYLAQLPKERMDALQKLRNMIHEHVPNVEETIKYKMPTFELNGKPIFSIASQKQYVSFYVMDISLLDPFRHELKTFNLGKSCIRFKKESEIPFHIIENIILNYQ